MTRLFSIILAAALLASPVAFVGCDRTVHEETRVARDDGETEVKKMKVTKDPITGEVEVEKSRTETEVK